MWLISTYTNTNVEGIWLISTYTHTNVEGIWLISTYTNTNVEGMWLISTYTNTNVEGIWLFIIMDHRYTILGWRSPVDQPTSIQTSDDKTLIR